MSVVIQFFKELGPFRLALAAFALLVFIIFFGYFISKVSSKNMVILYSNLELQDSNKIIEELESRNISYELLSGGSTIKVPEDQVLKLRVNMAEDGIPGSGSIVGYEIFDKEESLGSTSFLQNVKMIRALEGELIRTIESLDKIEKSRIHLVIPRKELFSKERQEPRASVVLKLKGNSSLSKVEVEAISNLVASSVPELDVQNITIVDTKGRSLKLALRDDETMGASSSNDDRKIQTEQKLRRVVEELLEKTLGSGKVIAQVNLQMNFDRIVENSELFDPDSAVVRSEQSVSENEKTPTGGEENLDVSVANNIPGGGLEDSSGGNFATLSRTDDTKNYEISKTIVNKIRDSGAIEQMSVAVLIDGNYTTDADGNKQYQPKSDQELTKISDIVKVAVGFNQDRNDKVSVINMPFVQDVNQMDDDDLEDWIKDQLPTIIETIVIATVTLLIFIVVIRPIAIKAFDIKKADTGIDPKLQSQLSLNSDESYTEDDLIINISKSSIPKQQSSKKLLEINNSVEQYPQETLALLKRWLNEEQGPTGGK